MSREDTASAVGAGRFHSAADGFIQIFHNQGQLKKTKKQLLPLELLNWFVNDQYYCLMISLIGTALQLKSSSVLTWTESVDRKNVINILLINVFANQRAFSGIWPALTSSAHLQKERIQYIGFK